MEQRIKLTQSTVFDISHEEMKHLYTMLALFQYQYGRNPDYNEITLRRRLRNDFYRFNLEIIKAHENDPNNLRLSQIRNFFECHYGSLKQIVNLDAKESITL